MCVSCPARPVKKKNKKKIPVPPKHNKTTSLEEQADFIAKARLGRLLEVTNSKDSTELARKIGITPNAIYNAINANRLPDTWVLKLREEYFFSLDYVYFNELPPALPPRQLDPRYPTVLYQRDIDSMVASQVERLLRERRPQYEAYLLAIEVLPVGVLRLGQDGSINYANSAARLGLQITGPGPYQFITYLPAGDRRQQFLDDLYALLPGESLIFPFPLDQQRWTIIHAYHLTVSPRDRFQVTVYPCEHGSQPPSRHVLRERSQQPPFFPQEGTE